MISMSNTQPAEVAHDHKLVELFKAERVALTRVEWKLSTLRNITADGAARYNTRKDFRTEAEIVSAAEDLVNAGDAHIITHSGKPSKFITEFYVEKLALKAAKDAIVEHEAAYTGWQRFLLVTSSAGLVHATMDCHTCNKGRKLTQFALLPDFSGRPVEQLVEAVGPALCSVCFPQAPVEWTEQERISPSLAQVLFDDGYDAFVKAREVSRKRSEKAAATRAANEEYRRNRRAAGFIR